MTPILVLSIVCITLFTLLGLYLLTTKKGTKSANRILGSFFILWSFDLLDGLLLLQGYHLQRPHFALWTEPFFLLYGPFLYAYTRLTLGHNIFQKSSFLLHFAPFVLGFLLLFFSFHSKSAPEKIIILEGITEFDQPLAARFIPLVVYIHFAIYLWKSKKLIGLAKKRLENFYSYFNLTWLNQLLNLMIFILVLSLVSGVVQYGGGKTNYELVLTTVLILVGVFLGTIIFKALDRPFLTTPANKRKTNENLLEAREAKKILSAITNSLETEQLYLIPELTLKDLSEAVGHPSRRVSQVINDCMDKSFFELVNGYRINAAKKIFRENTDKKLTVLEVLYAVGFNSKSSFNTQFKKNTGMTPSAYLKSMPK